MNAVFYTNQVGEIVGVKSPRVKKIVVLQHQFNALDQKLVQIQARMKKMEARFAALEMGLRGEDLTEFKRWNETRADYVS